MANWGQLDYNPLSAESKAVEAAAEELRKNLQKKGLVSAWPWNHLVAPGYSPELVREHCVLDAQWQTFRLSLKGLATHQKIQELMHWFERNEFSYRAQVQVGNYLGALRRGGQLDSENRIRKYR